MRRPGGGATTPASSGRRERGSRGRMNAVDTLGLRRNGFGGNRFRTASTRACTGAGVPAFSPHDLRHRRISLLHLGGVPWARIGEHVGQRNLAVTANTYTHVLVDESELDYESLLAVS